MTLADVGRDRRKGGDGRSRPRPKDRLPQPRAVAGEVRELTVRLVLFGEVYGLEHDALVTLAASDVHVQTSPSDTTLAAVMDPKNEEARDRCRTAVDFLRKARANVDSALKAFGSMATQPERSPDSVVSESTFDMAVNRARHRQREEELRHG